MSSRLHLAAALVLLAGAGCDRIRGDGVLRVEPRSVGDGFHAVSVGSGVLATVAAGLAPSVTVSGDENVVSRLDTEVVGGVLEVRLAVDGYESVHPLRVVATLPLLDRVDATEQSRVSVSGVQAEAFAVRASDGAEVVLAGPGGATLSVELSGGDHGGATLDASGYRVSDGASVVVSSGARARIDSDGDVTGEISGASTLENDGSGACTGVSRDTAAVVTCAL